MPREEKLLFDAGFIKLKKVIDPDKHCNGYIYSERKGVDSIAFICFDRDNPGQYLLNHEFTPPNGNFMFRAFGGSIDKNKTKEEIVIDEVREEVGYKVSNDRVKFVGKCFVSTQMNQTCYLYAVDITDLEIVEREPENAIEAMASPCWLSHEAVFDGDDWKSISIIAKLNVNEKTV